MHRREEDGQVWVPIWISWIKRNVQWRAGIHFQQGSRSSGTRDPVGSRPVEVQVTDKDWPPNGQQEPGLQGAVAASQRLSHFPEGALDVSLLSRDGFPGAAGSLSNE